MLDDKLHELVRKTTEHAKQWSSGEEHTVAAGILTEFGQIVLGLNTYHFLGGPCG
ncbi:MAG: hypothetical protein QM571_02445 [Micrococcaceae bacterium]